jgi:hypothetical protein
MNPYMYSAKRYTYSYTVWPATVYVYVYEYGAQGRRNRPLAL